MNAKRIAISLVVCFVLMIGSSMAVAGKTPHGEPIVSQLVTGLEGASGSTIGPDGALYVTEGAAGRVSRVDPQTGEVSTFASGLPASIVGIGGAIDVIFMGNTAYVLVTIVGPDVGGSDVVGIYRVDGPDQFTVIADIGEWSINNPSESEVFIPSGVQYALESYGGALLVTDGHHNRVLLVTLDGEISELMAFGNTVPTGLEVWGRKIFMAEAGPNPHLPEDGKVLVFGLRSRYAKEVASGARLLVDVEFGRGSALYALSQGEFMPGSPDGSPALPNTGALVKVNKNRTFTTIVDKLNQPTSFEFIGNTAYVVSLAGEIWKIDNVFGMPLTAKR